MIIPPSGGLAIGSTIGGATAGSLLFTGSGGVLAQDDASLSWDDANHRLVVNSILADLTIVNAGNSVVASISSAGLGTFGTLRLPNNRQLGFDKSDGTANYWQIYADGSDVLQFQGNGSNRASLTTGGVLTATTLQANNGLLAFVGTDSTTAGQAQGNITPSWATNTHASRLGRLQGFASDFTGTDREGWRIESDGTQPLVSVYGVAAVARQILATGAGHTVDDVIAVLQNFGIARQS